MPSDPDDEERTASVGSTVAEETTRVAATRYLEGAPGHGVLSLVFLAVSGVLYFQDVPGVAVMTGIIAYGVALHGLSIYLWDELRAYFEATFDRGDETATRTLTPHRVSPEMKAELATGAVMVGGFTVCLWVALGVLRTLSVRQGVSIAVGVLVFGDLAALWRVYARG